MKAVTLFMANKAAFFDRDGTLNVDIHYLYRSEDFVWTKDATAAVKYCNDNGYKVIVVTNQSGVARGYYTEEDVQRLHAWMNQELAAENAHIDAFYYCPHHTEGTVAAYKAACGCRKPSPKMVNEACADFQVDKARSFFIGDTASDMQCAANAGICGQLFAGGSLLASVRTAEIKVSGKIGEK
jgi:D-glycero-D-manno-heptose 1,7-bisphosphate phosphatase